MHFTTPYFLFLKKKVIGNILTFSSSPISPRSSPDFYPPKFMFLFSPSKKGNKSKQKRNNSSLAPHTPDRTDAFEFFRWATVFPLLHWRLLSLNSCGGEAAPATPDQASPPDSSAAFLFLLYPMCSAGAVASTTIPGEPGWGMRR